MAVAIDRDEDDDVCEIWQDNWPVWLAFRACDTQWRMVARGMTGAITYTGLDYAALDLVLRRRGLDEAAWDDVREIERGAMEAIATLERDS